MPETGAVYNFVHQHGATSCAGFVAALQQAALFQPLSSGGFTWRKARSSARS
jgi:hypothetical protein